MNRCLLVKNVTLNSHSALNKTSERLTWGRVEKERGGDWKTKKHLTRSLGECLTPDFRGLGVIRDVVGGGWVFGG